MNIKFSINGQKISILERPTTISYTNELEAEFSFSNEWAGRQKTAIFKRTGIHAIPVLIENDKCIVPKEVLRNCSKFEVGVIAGNIHTTNIVEVYIDRTCYNEDAEIPDPTPNIYDQIIEKLESIIKGGEGGEGGIGPQGPAGPQGPKGDAGKSAYQIAVDNGYVGTESEWLETLKGADGKDGAQGPQGIQGEQGPQGDKGDTGPQGPQGPKGDAAPAEIVREEIGKAITEGSISNYDDTEIKENVNALKRNINDIALISPNLFDTSNLHSGRLAVGNAYGVGVEEDAKAYYTDLIPTKAGDTFSVNKKFNWRQTVLLLYNNGAWVEYVNFEENTDGSYSATVPSSSNCNEFAITVITSDIESSSSYQMIETLMLVKGDYSKIPTEYMAYGEAKLVAKVSENMLDEKLKEKINNPDANTDNTRIEPTLYGNGIINASVGSKLSIDTNNFRQVYYAEIEENTGYFITFLRADANGTYNGWCVVDSEKKVLSISGAFQSANGSYVPPISGAKYLYYQVENDRTTTIFKDNGKFKIFNGEYTKFKETNIIKSASGEVKNTNTKFRGYDVATIIPSIDGEAFTIPVDSKKYSNVGVWTRMRYKDSQNLTSLKIATNNNDGNSVDKSLFEMDSNWHLLKVQSTGGVTTDITLTLSYVDNIAIDIALCVVGDQFTRPTILLNFDQAWLASEACGLYDYLFDNNIPFTITGTINKVSEEMKAKLKRQNQNGLLDIGTYGNEVYDSTYYPCSDSISDYATALRNLENVYTKKIEYAEKPISFGASGHKYTPLVTRAIKDSGYKVCKTSSNQYGINSDFDGDLITVCVSAYNGNYTPIEPTVLGCCYGFFAHGVSSSPSQEEDPTMYYEWSIVKQLLDYFKNLRDKGCVQFINMRQLYEILQNDNIN